MFPGKGYDTLGAVVDLCTQWKKLGLFQEVFFGGIGQKVDTRCSAGIRGHSVIEFALVLIELVFYVVHTHEHAV